MKHLHLPLVELIKIGFKDDFSNNRLIMKIETINGYFYYNSLNTNYVWYHKTIIGEVANDIELKITTEKELETILNVFRCKYSNWL